MADQWSEVMAGSETTGRQADAAALGEVAESDTTKLALLASMEECLKTFGGPSQYLTKVLESKPNYTDFMEWLWQEFPEAEDAVFSFQSVLPSISEDEIASSLPLVVHVGTLGFTPQCTLKPPLGQELAMRLVQQFLVEGFKTGDQPLYVLQHSEVCLFPEHGPWMGQGQEAARGLKPFNLSYLKGFARATSLLMLLHRVKESGINLSEHLPDLHESICKIHVQVVRQASRMDEALSNMQISARHSLRTAPNTVVSVFTIRNLMKVGGLQDVATFIKKWNAMTSRAFQITGRRHIALKLLFEVAPKDWGPIHRPYQIIIHRIISTHSSIVISESIKIVFDANPQDVLEDILNHVQTFSWDQCAWSDDTLSSKKLYPGWSFPGKGQWQSRLRRASG